jgi:hypothetical protein
MSGGYRPSGEDRKPFREVGECAVHGSLGDTEDIRDLPIAEMYRLMLESVPVVIPPPAMEL